MRGNHIFITLILLIHAQLCAAEVPDQETLDRMGNGEILLLDTPKDTAAETIRVQAIFYAAPKVIEEVIISCEQKFTYVGGLKTCEVIEDEGGRVLIHQVVKKNWYAPTLDFVYESLRYPNDGVHFKLVDGNLKTMEGAWQFTATSAGLLVNYELRVTLSIPVPASFMKNDIQKDMLNLVACIRALAGGSGSKEQKKEDRGRCQGKRITARQD